MSSKKPKETYRETYAKGTTIRQELLPDRFPFTAEGWRVDAIEVMAAGELADGRQFHEIRIYNREVRHAKPDLVDGLGDPPPSHPAPDPREAPETAMHPQEGPATNP